MICFYNVKNKNQCRIIFNNYWHVFYLIIILLNLDDKEAYIELNSPFKNSTIINLLDENDKYVNENNKITIKMNAFSSKILKEI